VLLFHPVRTHVARIRLGCRGALYSPLSDILTEPHKQRSTFGGGVLIGFPFLPRAKKTIT